MAGALPAILSGGGVPGLPDGDDPQCGGQYDPPASGCAARFGRGGAGHPGGCGAGTGYPDLL